MFLYRIIYIISVFIDHVTIARHPDRIHAEVQRIHILTYKHIIFIFNEIHRKCNSLFTTCWKWVGCRGRVPVSRQISLALPYLHSVI